MYLYFSWKKYETLFSNNLPNIHYFCRPSIPGCCWIFMSCSHWISLWWFLGRLLQRWMSMSIRDESESQKDGKYWWKKAFLWIDGFYSIQSVGFVVELIQLLMSVRSMSNYAYMRLILHIFSGLQFMWLSC